jgi:exonuclease III
MTFWNIDGLQNLFRLEWSEELNLLQEDVIALVETWSTTETSLTGPFNKYYLIQSPAVRDQPRGRGKGGVMLLVNKLMFIVKSQSVLNDYIFAKLQIRKTQEIILVAAIYVPPLDTQMRLERCDVT